MFDYRNVPVLLPSCVLSDFAPTVLSQALTLAAALSLYVHFCPAVICRQPVGIANIVLRKRTRKLFTGDASTVYILLYINAHYIYVICTIFIMFVVSVMCDPINQVHCHRKKYIF